MTAPFPGRAAPRLNIGDAVHDGWQAFCRSPGAFVLFALLLWGLQVLFQLLQARIGTAAALSADPADWLLALVGLVGSLTSYFWGTIGMVRGALMGLEGRRPRFADLIRWDGGAITRLFWAALLLGALLLAALAAITVLLGGPLGLLTAMADARAGSLSPGLQLMTLVVAVLLLLLVGFWLVGLIYVSVNQQFQAQISLTERLGPWATLRRSRALVDPHWPLLLLLVIVEALLSLLGVLACFVGFFVAWPVVVCVSTAAYRQLLALEAAPPPLPEANRAP
ncbi:MAG: hypothetical protein NTV57_18180 [Cyanobacteria bacterium]|nr:hypothetical protein [Cyanobacteriota bacterium]